MVRSLPPLTALRAFEAAARHLSFTRAADELGMTQAAVSYQIKVLEERVGAALFVRTGRQVVLTAAAHTLVGETTLAFDRIAAAYGEARGATASVLSINSIPTFASLWLARHLGEFQVAHPSVAVQLACSRDLVDFAREPVDAVLRAGDGNWPGLCTHMLVRGDFSPMLSPALLERIGHPLREPADLLRYPLVDPGYPWWDLWFESVGVRRDNAGDPDRSKLSSQDLEAIAAVAGHGVAMLTPFFYRDQVASGALIQPFAHLYPINRAYYLVYPESRCNVPKIRLFRDWIISHFPETACSNERRVRTNEAAFRPEGLGHA
ncbi:LysR substrate-binding domain-containing protein [Aurantimonas endophytica]|uniref:LysR family glycine cleavage system transcriptional activator n=1 Tax=Aurantimonas endophytica TaxID=1522175 RepID=A0A7W6MS15_9HYPH|nr:LysR substrate-binding domain-containing protein [Aurantimonas endophytica]MBB4005569.1 LysR family glycine cleavage system transcriptional activator [Aurantimonas endophytica]MCO6406461.1 LysR family transcriptional regulator [Aurantimonas endophytica]